MTTVPVITIFRMLHIATSFRTRRSGSKIPLRRSYLNRKPALKEKRTPVFGAENGDFPPLSDIAHWSPSLTALVCLMATEAREMRVDFARTASDYARYRVGFPDSFFE